MNPPTSISNSAAAGAATADGNNSDNNSFVSQLELPNVFARNLEHMIVKKDTEALDRLVGLLCRLEDTLHPYIHTITSGDIYYDKLAQDEEAAAMMEREKHMELLHKSLDSVKVNLKHVKTINGKKSRHQIKDNMDLLAEIEALRNEVS